MIDIIATAKNMGICVYVADQNPNAPAMRFADVPVPVSTARVDTLASLCKQEGIDGIFTGFEDFNIHIAEELCRRTSLPFYATRKQLETVTDKTAFKAACRQYGVKTVEEYTLAEAVAEGKYPYIVKPADSYGSRGITVCHNAEELRDGVEKARLSSRTSHVIIERFIGTDHGCELFYTLVGGHIHLTVTADRYVVKEGKTTVPLPVAEVFPSRHRDALVKALDEPVRKMLTGMGLRDGLVLIQALYDVRDGKEEFFVYEMAYRLTGEQHYRLFEKQNGVSLGEMMIRLSLGEDISSFDTPLLDDTAWHAPAINLAMILKEGKLHTLSGLDKVYRLDEVVYYNLTHKAGDIIYASGDYSHMLIRVGMVAENYEKLCHAVRRAGELVTALDEGGNDLLVSRFSLPKEV